MMMQPSATMYQAFLQGLSKEDLPSFPSFPGLCDVFPSMWFCNHFLPVRFVFTHCLRFVHCRPLALRFHLLRCFCIASAYLPPIWIFRLCVAVSLDLHLLFHVFTNSTSSLLLLLLVLLSVRGASLACAQHGKVLSLLASSPLLSSLRLTPLGAFPSYFWIMRVLPSPFLQPCIVSLTSLSFLSSSPARSQRRPCNNDNSPPLPPPLPPHLPLPSR